MQSGDSGNSFSEKYLQKRFVSRKFFDGTDPISKKIHLETGCLAFPGHSLSCRTEKPVSDRQEALDTQWLHLLKDTDSFHS